MQLSTRARYGLRLMLQLVRSGGDVSNISISQIAKQTLLPRRYLEQLAVGLRNASLLISTTGREGGYRLAKPPAEISIREIIEASIGPIKIVGCVGDSDACMWEESCECRLLYNLINNRITETLDGFSLADMTGPEWGDRLRRELGQGSALPMVESGPETPRS